MVKLHYCENSRVLKYIFYPREIRLTSFVNASALLVNITRQFKESLVAEVSEIGETNINNRPYWAILEDC